MESDSHLHLADPIASAEAGDLTITKSLLHSFQREYAASAAVDHPGTMPGMGGNCVMQSEMERDASLSSIPLSLGLELAPPLSQSFHPSFGSSLRAVVVPAPPFVRLSNARRPLPPLRPPCSLSKPSSIEMHA